MSAEQADAFIDWINTMSLPEMTESLGAEIVAEMEMTGEFFLKISIKMLMH